LRHIRQLLAALPQPFRVQAGCGGNCFAGWLNLDEAYWEDRPDSAVGIWDLRDGLPLADGSCQYIYSEHFVEHLTVEDSRRYFRECYRVLLPGGVVRTAMPSLDNVLAKVAAGRWREQDWLTWPEYRQVETQAEMLNMVFRWWGHQWLYDREELARRLRECGFEQLCFPDIQVSEHAELRERETRHDSLLICEATRS
jgi:predicted SAM-dependent methyltransferase